MPEHGLASWALVLSPADGNAASLEKQFRCRTIPIVGRIENDKMILDLRTIQDDDIPQVLEMLQSFSRECAS